MYLTLVTACVMASALVYPVQSRESLTANGGFAWEYDSCNTILAILRLCKLGPETPGAPTNTRTSGGLPSSYRPPAILNPPSPIRPSSSGLSSIIPRPSSNSGSEPNARELSSRPRGGMSDDYELMDAFEMQKSPSYGIEDCLTCDQMIEVTAAIENAWTTRRCSRRN